MDEQKSVIEALDKIEARINEMPSKSEIDSLTEEQMKLSKQLLDLQQKGLKINMPAVEAKSMGQQVIEHAAFKAVADGSSPKCRIEVKGLGDPITTPTGGIVPAYRRPGVLAGAFRPFTIEQLLPSIPISTNAFEYVKENSFTNSAAFVAEGAQKPFSAIDFQLATGNIRTIAHMVKVSKQMLADAPALVAYINTRLVYGLDLVVEDQIVTGNGSNQSLSGLLNTGNFTAHAATLADVGGSNATLFDLILFAKTKVAKSFFRPDAVLLNPEDWALLQMTKNSSGDYYLGHPSTVTDPVLWGMRVVASPAVTKGKFLVLDTTQTATVWNREGITVEIFEQDADNVQKNLVTIRAERRMGLSIERPLASVGGTLALPSAGENDPNAGDPEGK